MATYAYLIDPNKQYITKSGTINTAGILRVYDASTDDPVITYKDFMGTENEEAIVLDNNGRAIVIVDSDKAYRLEVYDRYNTLQWTVTPLWCQAGGDGASIARTEIVSSDGTVEITKTTVGSTTTFDLSTDVEDSTDLLEWIRCEGNEIHDGVYVPLYVGGTMEVLDDGIGMYADRYYHVTAHIKCNKPTTLQPFYDDVKVHFVGRDIDDSTDEFTFQSFKLDVDYTMAMPQVFEVSTDIISLKDFELLIKIDDVEISGATFEVSDIAVHRVFSGMPALPGGAASKPWAEEKFQPILTPGTGITIDDDNVISATAAQQQQADWDQANTGDVTYIRNKPDLSIYATKEEVDEGLDEKQDVLTAGDNIVIENNVISATAAPQVNSDWEATSGPAEILHKPDLSIYATQSDLADKQDTLIPGEGITIENNVISVDGGTFTQVNSDWDATSGVQKILNKPDLSIYAEKSELATVATTGDYDDLLNKPTITQPVNADWDSNSGLSQILNKPDLSQYATQSDLADKQDTLTPGDNITIVNNIISATAAAQVNSDWDATSGVQEILNKPDLSIYAEKSELATVATTGSYNDLTDKPTIVTPVNADWNSTTGLSKILNKPTLATVATTGSYNDLTDKPTIVGQVNSDWDATSGVQEILNKPNEIALVAGENITLTKEGNELTISAQGGGGGGAPQVNSDWNATSGVAMILNKPVEANVIAGDNITITESGSTITIAATAAPQQNADWNATSGVQEILNKPTIPSGVQLVPAATSADADKVLTVDSQGTPAWASAQAPISAGTGIDITHNVVSVDTSVVATQTDLAGKQDTISDLATIRSGAAAGATAVQPGDLATVATTGDYDDLTDKPDLSIYATGSELTAGLATKQDTISDLATIRSGAAAGATAVQPGDLATVATTGDYDDLTDKPDLSVYATTAAMNTALASKQDTISDLATIRSGAADGATAVQPGDLATVATSGSYTDLSNKPTIPSGTQLVPSATSADADKVLTVNALGVPTWAAGGGGGTQADWAEADPTEPSYIENKPVPKTLVAGTGITITESSSELTVASTNQLYSAGTGLNLNNAEFSVDTTVIQPKLVAGANITIDPLTNEISGEGGADWDATSGEPGYIENKPYMVDIVAGPGIVVDNPDGNTLRVSTDQNYETVLWSGTAASVDTAKSGLTLTESPFNFEYVEVHWVPWAYNDASSYKQEAVVRVHLTSSFPRIGLINEWTDESNAAMFLFSVNGYFTSAKFYTTHVKWFQIGSWTVNTTGTGQFITRIVGVHRIANN